MSPFGRTAPRQRRQRPLGAADPRQPTAKRQGLARWEVDALLVAQSGRCAVGGEPLGESFAVDHCHACAAAHGHDPEKGCPKCFRGLVCNKHNGILGWFHDSPEELIRAALYVAHGKHPVPDASTWGRNDA